MKGIAAIASVLLLAACALAYDPKLTGDAWQSKSASEKFNTISKEVKANAKPYGWYSIVHTAEIFLEGMDKSFDFAGDDMPDQGLFNAEQRPKLIHSVGSVAAAQFISNKRYNYTGVFRGADDCFVRFSLAAKPTTSPPLTVPGIAFKCMRDNVPSSNVFAMWSLAGQESFNFFEHDFTNHPPDFNPDNIGSAQKQLKKKFEEASKWPTMVGLSNLAMFDKTGAEERNPVFPFRIVFHPTTDVHNKFPSAPQSGDSFFLDQLATLAPGPLFTVFVQREPWNPTLEEIGTLALKDAPSSSRWGDKDMFFQHQRMEDDVALRPDWAADIDAIIEEQQTAPAPGFEFPDLPWN